MIKRVMYLIVLYILINAISPKLAQALLMLLISIIYSLVRLLSHSMFDTARLVKYSVASTFLRVDTSQALVSLLLVIMGVAILLAMMEIVNSVRK